MGLVFLSRVYADAGTTVMAMKSEARRVNTMVRHMGASRSRTRPEVNIMGRNTHTVVRVEAIMEPATCLVPCTAARGASMP